MLFFLQASLAHLRHAQESNWHVVVCHEQTLVFSSGVLYKSGPSAQKIHVNGRTRRAAARFNKPRHLHFVKHCVSPFNFIVGVRFPRSF